MSVNAINLLTFDQDEAGGTWLENRSLFLGYVFAPADKKASDTRVVPVMSLSPSINSNGEL